MTQAKQLTLDDLANGLEHFGSRYDALDVFARDIKDIGKSLMDRRLEGVRPVSNDAIAFERSGKSYQLRVHGPSGVARLSRSTPAQGLSDNQVTLGVLGAAFGATVLDKALPSALLGFLVGAALGTPTDSARRVFTMSYDPVTHEWGAYDGPLSRVVREKRREAERVLGVA